MNKEIIEKQFLACFRLQIEESRDMFKDLTKEVVTFLKKTHRNLEFMKVEYSQQNRVHRSCSEYQVSCGAEPSFGTFRSEDNKFLEM